MRLNNSVPEDGRQLRLKPGYAAFGSVSEATWVYASGSALTNRVRVVVD